MSLIHDALRRVQAQRSGGSTGSPAEPGWQPVPPPPPRSRPWGWVLLGMVAAFGLVLVWEGWRTRQSEQGLSLPERNGGVGAVLPAETTTARPEPADRGPAGASGPAKASGTDVVQAIPVPGGDGPGGVARAVSEGSADFETGLPPHGGSEASAPVPPQTGSVAGVPGTAAVPALRLQGIFYHPQRPVAVINQRTVGPGSELAGWRVLRIEPERVILVGHGQTNVLELP